MSNDLEECWALVRAHSPIRRVSNKPSNIEGQLELACEKAIHDLTQEFQDRKGQLVSLELLSDMVAHGIRAFMKHWLDGLRNQNLAGLIEIVLEGQKDMSPDEMMGFMRGIPTTLLEKIATSGLGTASGIHALIGVESARRRGEVRRYKIARDGFRVYVKFENVAGDEIQFYLDEPFEVDP